MNDDDKPPIDLHLRFLDALIIVLCILCFLALLTWAQNRDIEDAVEMHKQEASRVTKMLADCLNGLPLYDKNTNTALFCDKPIEVKF